ncbi:hypothetical protein [Streptomyces sp. NPDC029003]|uniref:hypothetical protein n=1 Tax=Streptomyces sp. NPDC029003 TaxID=3155125 RepID=UPI0033DA6449
MLDDDGYVSTVARIDGAQVTADLAKWLESQGLPPRVGAAVTSLCPQLDSAADRAVSKVAGRFVSGRGPRTGYGPQAGDG